MLDTIRKQTAELVSKYGKRTGVATRIALRAFMPCGGVIADCIEEICNYQQQNEQSDTLEKIRSYIEQSGEREEVFEQVLTCLNGRLDSVLTQVSLMGQHQMPDEALIQFVQSQITQNGELAELKERLTDLVPELSAIQASSQRLLEGQRMQGDILLHVRDSVDAALSFSAPSLDGLTGVAAVEFLGTQQRFQLALLNADLSGAEQALGEMRDRAPNSPTVTICSIALNSINRRFQEADQLTRGLSQAVIAKPRIHQMIVSVKTLTRRAQSVVPAKKKLPSLSPKETDKKIDLNSVIGSQRWLVEQLVGRGGMGSVWQVKNSFGDEGALKAIDSNLSADIDFIQRFQSEIQTLRKISHPSVVSILDWGQDQSSGSWYFVMPFIKGVSLRRKLKERALTEAEVKAITISIAEGLRVCHQLDVIHRDIKPENIMILDDLTPILIDFGIAYHADSTGETKLASGGYAPPEQQAGRPTDHTADLYALAMTIAECLGAKAATAPWVTILNKLTHIIPAKRGDVNQLLEALNPQIEVFLANKKERSTALPLSEAAQLLIEWGEGEQIHVWTKGLESWIPWRSYSALVEAVSNLKGVEQALTPPSLPPELTPPPFLADEPDEPAGQAHAHSDVQDDDQDDDQDDELQEQLKDIESLFDDLLDEDDDDDYDTSDGDGAFAALSAGVMVRVLSSVSNPEHGWGEVTHHSIGRLVSIDGKKAKVDFPNHKGWSAKLSELESVTTSSRGSISEIIARLRTNAGHWLEQADLKADEPEYFSHFFMTTRSNNSYISNGSIVRGLTWDNSSMPKFKVLHGNGNSDGEFWMEANEMTYLGPDWRAEWSDWSSAYMREHGNSDGMNDFNHMPVTRRSRKSTNSALFAPLAEGVMVRVSESVSEPKYGWGEVSHHSIGRLVSIDGEKAKVDFPEQGSWSAASSELESLVTSSAGPVEDIISRLQRNAGHWAEQVDVKKDEPEYFSHYFMATDTGNSYISNGAILKGLDWDNSNIPKYKTLHGHSQSDGEWYIANKKVTYLGPAWRNEWLAWSSAYAREHGDSDGMERFEYRSGEGKFASGAVVRVRRGVRTPKHQWGGARPGMVGRVHKHEERLIKIDFEELSHYWNANRGDLELVSSALDWVRADYDRYCYLDKDARGEFILKAAKNRLFKWISVANDGDGEACFLVGKYYDEAPFGEGWDEPKAIEYYRLGAKAGNPYCCTNLANHVGSSESRELRKRAAANGSWVAANFVAESFIYGKNGFKENLDEAIKYLKYASESRERFSIRESDWETARSDYASIQARPHYEREDLIKSLDHFDEWKKAADEGCAEACYIVAKCYDEGVLVSSDRQKCKRYYKRGYLLGNPFCITNYSNQFAPSDDELILYELAAMLGSYAGAHNFLINYEGSDRRRRQKMERLKRELAPR